MKIKYKILIAIFLLISLLSIFLYKYQKNTTKILTLPQEDSIDLVEKNIIPRNNSSVEENVFEPNITLEINGNRYESNISSEITIYDFMERLRSEGRISFVEKNYIGIGKFIEEINNIRGNGEKYWIYYINNKEANIGISDYKIRPGDVVSWKLEDNKY